MPASLRTSVSRGMASSSRPYDRRSPSASPAQSANPPAHLHLSRSLPPTPPVEDADADTPPDHPGLPTYAEYKRIEAGYLHSLSPRKRDKALITQAMFDKIWDVLHQPDACTIETPQFRFWVRKMFSLSRPMCVGIQGDAGWGEVRVGGTDMGTYPDVDLDSSEGAVDLELERAMGIEADTSTDLFDAVVLHENRPVAIVEQLYELFCYCHVRAGHGGRDKTCAVIRQHYSWVPKELTAQFVKACPTCALKRSGHGHHAPGVGVDMGVLVQRRVRKVYGTLLGGEETPVSVVPSSLGGVGWPLTGGPLDPANPEPCGVGERAWLRVHGEDARTIDPASLPVSPPASASDPRPRHIPLESCLPRALMADASPFRSVMPFAMHERETRSPTRTGLPCLASALSNESLDENVNLTGLGPETAGECLPPVLRPLRLSGPMIPFDAEPDLYPPPSESHFFQIDPVLLSFSYPASSDHPGHRDDGGDTMSHVASLCRLPHQANSESDEAFSFSIMTDG